MMVLRDTYPRGIIGNQEHQLVRSGEMRSKEQCREQLSIILYVNKPPVTTLRIEGH